MRSKATCKRLDAMAMLQDRDSLVFNAYKLRKWKDAFRMALRLRSGVDRHSCAFVKAAI